MTIKAVVLDIGSVLEVIDDSVFPGPFELRHGLAPGATGAIPEFGGDPGIGELTEAEVRAHIQLHLALSEEQADDYMRDYWVWYCGTLDQELFDWFAAQHGRFRTGIVSNSGPGAREAERHYGFEDITDDIVYSHEVGLAKPDPAIYALAAQPARRRAPRDRLPRRLPEVRRRRPRRRLARRPPRRHPDVDPRAGGDHRYERRSRRSRSDRHETS